VLIDFKRKKKGDKIMLRRRFIPSGWDELDRLQREMNRLFENYDRGFAPSVNYPAVNLWLNEDGAVVTAEVPGLDGKDLDISVVGETLTISGERKSDATSDDAVYHRQERSFGKFTRMVELPFVVEATKVQANLENGVLRIFLPRAEQDRPRKITVKAN
jgi:HSP20 family protein